VLQLVMGIATSGIVASVVAAPFDVLRTRLVHDTISGGRLKTATMFDAISTVAEERGCAQMTTFSSLFTLIRPRFICLVFSVFTPESSPSASASVCMVSAPLLPHGALNAPLDSSKRATNRIESVYYVSSLLFPVVQKLNPLKINSRNCFRCRVPAPDREAQFKSVPSSHIQMAEPGSGLSVGVTLTGGTGLAAKGAVRSICFL
jgi:hypothetical protein